MAIYASDDWHSKPSMASDEIKISYRFFISSDNHNLLSQKSHLEIPVSLLTFFVVCEFLILTLVFL